MCKMHNCGHSFHAECIGRWRNAGASVNHLQCPYCRQEGPPVVAAPKTYAEVMTTIESLPPWLRVVYVDTPRPEHVSKSCALLLLSSSMSTLVEMQNVAMAIVAKRTTIKHVYGPEPEDDVCLEENILLSPEPHFDLSSVDTTPFFRMLALAHATTYEDNTFQVLNFLRGESSEIDYESSSKAEWDGFVSVVGRHARSVRELSVINFSSIDDFGIDLSTLTMPNLRKLSLLLNSTHFEKTTLPKHIVSLQIGYYNYSPSLLSSHTGAPSNNTIGALANKLNKIDTVRALKLESCSGWESMGISVLASVLALADQGLTVLHIESCPSLFVETPCSASNFFEALANRRLANVRLIKNGILGRFVSWSNELMDETKHALVQSWSVSESE